MPDVAGEAVRAWSMQQHTYLWLRLLPGAVLSCWLLAGLVLT
jgi:hypothetical protein